MTDRNNRKRWIIAGILIMLLCLSACNIQSGIKGSAGAGEDAQVNESGISDFAFTYREEYNNKGFSCKVEKKSDHAVLTYENSERADLGVMTKTLDLSILDQLKELYQSNHIAAWDGYDKKNELVRGDNVFSLVLHFEDGGNLYARGTNVFPSGFTVFKEAAAEIFDPITLQLMAETQEKIIDQGIQGTIDSITASFTHSGPSRTDSYDIFLYTRKFASDTNNFNLTARSYSGEFLPEGEYRSHQTVDEKYLKLSEIQALVDKYDLIQWFGWDRESAENQENEQFSLTINYTNGQTLNTKGNVLPPDFKEFRHDFLELMTECYQEISALEE